MVQRLLLLLLLFGALEAGEPSRYFILGAAGAGKSTQAALLAERLELPHISCGQLFRDEVAAGTERGKVCQEYMERGELVPPTIVTETLFARLKQEDCAEGFVLDGFPRTLPLWKRFEERLDEEAHVTAVLIEVAPEIATKRCLARGERSSDREEVLARRLQIEAEKLRPVVEYLSTQNQLRRVDGESSIEEVAARVYQAAIGE